MGAFGTAAAVFYNLVEGDWRRSVLNFHHHHRRLRLHRRSRGTAAVAPFSTATAVATVATGGHPRRCQFSTCAHTSTFIKREENCRSKSRRVELGDLTLEVAFRRRIAFSRFVQGSGRTGERIDVSADRPKTDAHTRAQYFVRGTVGRSNGLQYSMCVHRRQLISKSTSSFVFD